MKTLEDIESEVKNSMIVRLQMKVAIDGLKKAEKKIGVDPLKILILGKRKLTIDEYTLAAKKFGVTGVNSIAAMERLSVPQKQYIFKQMGWDISEVMT